LLWRLLPHVPNRPLHLSWPINRLFQIALLLILAAKSGALFLIERWLGTRFKPPSSAGFLKEKPRLSGASFTPKGGEQGGQQDQKPGQQQTQKPGQGGQQGGQGGLATLPLYLSANSGAIASQL